MRKIIVLLGGLALLAACGGPKEEVKPVYLTKDSAEKILEEKTRAAAPKREDLLKQIESLEKELFASSDTLDPIKANKMVSLYEVFYQNYHKYPEAPDFLFKAGEITDNLNQPYRAIYFYTRCYEEYPNYKYVSECLFRMANLYDFKLSNYLKAKGLYMEVIEQFPKSQAAKDAEAALKLMTKTDQEMIREFEKKNGIKK